MKRDLLPEMSSTTTGHSGPPDKEPNPSLKPYRFLELPAEIRQVIYQYYYGSGNLVLKLSRSFLKSKPRSLNRAIRDKLSGVPDSSLRQVCRLLAEEATPFWSSRVGILTLNIGDCRRGAVNKFACSQQSGLKSRLITLKIVAEEGFATKKAWDALAESCPKLRNVEIVHTAVDDPFEWNIITNRKTAQQVFCEAMNMSSDEAVYILEHYCISDLVKAFELNGREDHNITGSSYEIFKNWNPESS